METRAHTRTLLFISSSDHRDLPPPCLPQRYRGFTKRTQSDHPCHDRLHKSLLSFDVHPCGTPSAGSPSRPATSPFNRRPRLSSSSTALRHVTVGPTRRPHIIFTGVSSVHPLRVMKNRACLQRLSLRQSETCIILKEHVPD